MMQLSDNSKSPELRDVIQNADIMMFTHKS